MDGLKHITGKEILQAIAHAKKVNPKDTYGEGAFKIDVQNTKVTDMVRYVPVHINVFCGKDDSGEDKWEFVPFNVRFRKVTTRNKIPTLQERQSSTIKSVTLQFRNTSKSYWVTKGGKEEEDPIGEALVASEKIIRRKITRLLKNKTLTNRVTNVNLFVQYEKKDRNTEEVLAVFEEPIIRMEIKFRKPNKDATNVEATAEPWQCTIYDATKPRPANQSPPGEPRFYPATVGFAEGDEYPVNYGNIHTFIRGGSSITGFLNLSQISLSGQGISLTPRFSTLVVKKSAGFKPTFAGNEWAGQLDDLGDAPVDTIEEDPHELGGNMSSMPSTPSAASAKTAKASDFANDADEFGDEFADDDGGDADGVDGDGGGVDDDLDGDDGLPDDDDFGDDL